MKSFATKTNKNKQGATRMSAPFLLFVLFLLVTACSSIDCPLNSLVYTQYQLMDATGRADTLSDTLTISTNRSEGNDSVLINKSVNTTTFSLPISYSHQQDIFFFETKDTLTKQTLLDTVNVTKEDTPHFESVDCAPAFFHKIVSIDYTQHNIDSVIINCADVNYDTSKKHVYIYFKK